MLVAVGGTLSRAAQPGDLGAEGGHPWSAGRSLCSLAPSRRRCSRRTRLCRDGAPGCLEMSLLLMAPGLALQVKPAHPTPALPSSGDTVLLPPVPLCCPALLALHPEPGTLPALSLQVSHVPSGSWVTLSSPLQPMVSTLQLHGPGFKSAERKGPPLEGSQLRAAQLYCSGPRLSVDECV